MLIVDLYNGVRHIGFKLIFWLYMIINLAAFIICVNGDFDTHYQFIRAADENFFLMGTETSFLLYIFMILFPITSCIIASHSLSTDFCSGRTISQCQRCGISKYISSKLISNIILTFLCSIIPLLINLLLCHIVYPSVGYDSEWAETRYNIGELSYDNARFLDMFRLEHATFYNIIHVLIVGIFAVLISVLALGISIFIKERPVLCFLLPIILSLTLIVIRVVLDNTSRGDFFMYNYLSPNSYGSVGKFILLIICWTIVDGVILHHGRKCFER